jgi:hypothetical protein
MIDVCIDMFWIVLFFLILRSCVDRCAVGRVSFLPFADYVK